MSQHKATLPLDLSLLKQHSEHATKHWERTSKKLLELLSKPAQRGLCQLPQLPPERGLRDDEVWERGSPSSYMHKQ